MRIFQTVTEFLKTEPKPGTKFLLGGKGLADGLKHPCRSNLIRLQHVTEGGIYIYQYRSKKPAFLPFWHYDQKVGLPNANELKNMDK